MILKTKILSAIALLCFTSIVAQKSTIDKDIKMYSQVWDDVINKGEIDKINATFFDENITGITTPENVVGIDAFKAYYQNFITGFSDRKFKVKNIFGQGVQLVKHWQFTGIHTGDFFGIPATGNKVDVEGVTIAKLKNGKIAQEQDFMDSSVMMQQLGLVSDPNNMAVIDGLYKAFAAGDIPSVLGAMNSKIEWNEAESNKLADGNPYIGPDAILNGVFVRLLQDFDDFKLTNIVLHEITKNKVLATLRYNATSKLNGKFYDIQAAHLWQLIDGKVVGFQQYADTKKLADAEMK